MNILKQKMIDLVDFLNYHQDLYDKGTPIISDKEWDKAYLELKELEENLGETLPSSPTQKVRYTVVNELKKVKHEYQPMLSLDKTKDIEEIKSFIGNKEWIAMLKLDGLTCRLTYEEGRLVRAETRGNGIEGEDITHNARVLPSIPQIIPYKDTLVIDGEVICDKTTFEQFKDEYANCRNFAAGSIRLLDSNECAKRGLTFVAWDVITGYEDYDTSLNRKLTTLIDYHFTIVPFSMLFLETVVDDLQEDNNKYCNYPIDGVVFKYNKNDDYYAAGRTEHHFRGGMAYKFYDEEYETELLDIEWSMGRTGVLTPVAVYKDIEIDGATCNRANLHNINILTELLGDSPLVGQKVWVYKANAIIPQIAKAQPAEEILGADPAYFWNDPEFTFLKPPLECPMCGGETEIIESDSGTLELYCTNPQCPGKLVNKLDHFCGKKGLDIKGLSKATLEKLIDWGWVSCVSDIFKLGEVADLWANKPGFGPKSVTKLIDAIYAARKCPLHAYLSAWSIPLIGKTYALQLAIGFITYEEFRKAVREGFDFTQLDKFGPERHETIINFDYSEADSLIERGIIEIVVNESNALENSGNALEGKTFCVTGKLKSVKNREEFGKIIEQHGGRLTSSVSKNIDYLINNDKTSQSNKNLSALKLNIPILTEEEFFNLINIIEKGGL